MRHSVPFRSQKSLPFRADQTGTPNDMTNRGTERSEIHAMPLRTDAMFASTSAYVQTNGQSGCGDPGVAYPTLFARLFAQVQEVRNFTDQRQSGMISRCGAHEGAVGQERAQPAIAAVRSRWERAARSIRSAVAPAAIRSRISFAIESGELDGVEVAERSTHPLADPTGLGNVAATHVRSRRRGGVVFQQRDDMEGLLQFTLVKRCDPGPMLRRRST